MTAKTNRHAAKRATSHLHQRSRRASSKRWLGRSRHERWLALTVAAIIAGAGITTASVSSAAPIFGPKTSSKSLLKPAGSFKTYKNIRYSKASSSNRLLLDLYTPNNNAKRSPLIIYVHGGGFVLGSKDKGCQPAEKQFMKRGFAVACINYRLATTSKWPAQIVDVKSAIRYLRANATKYNIYPTKIGMWGDSAGGHLVAMAGTAQVKKFDQGSNLKTSSAVQAVVDDFGPMNLEKLLQETKDPNLKAASALFGSNLIATPAMVKSANPLSYVSGNEPPFLIRHGDKDELVPLSHSQALDKALKAKSRKSQLIVMKGNGHGGDKFNSESSINTVVGFFDKHLRP